MKPLYRYLCILLALGMAACTREYVPETGGDKMPVHLCLALSEMQETRSIVSGADESSVNNLWLLCFNQVNTCVDVVSATLGAGNTITASIPRDTRTIHFVANRSFSSSFITQAKSKQMDVVLTDNALVSSVSGGEPMAFWGYYHGNSLGEVKNFLNRQTPGPETVYLLRDRARLVMEQPLPADISSVQWVLSNGLSAGYVVPFPYENYYRQEGGLYYGNTTAWPKTGASTYTASSSDLTSSDEPIYIFETPGNYNDMGSLVRVILRVTYTDNTVRYHNVLLTDQDGMPHQFLRGHNYKLRIFSLPKVMGHASFNDALAAKEFSNNVYITLDHDLPSASDGIYRLDITDPQGTSIMYHKGESKSVQFTYLCNGVPESGRTAADFSATWISNDGLTDLAAEPKPTVAYNSDGTGAVIFTLNTVDYTFRSGKILLYDKKHGISRFIEVFSITRFRFDVKPVLRKEEGVMRNGHQVYKLTFTLKDDIPDRFLPVKISFTSMMTLYPFSDTSPDSPSGTFDISMSSTDNLTESFGTSPFDWNYMAKSWGFWFNYTFTPTDMTTSAGRTLNIYFEDITSTRGITFNSVGLYLYIEDFGDLINNFDDNLHVNIL